MGRSILALCYESGIVTGSVIGCTTEKNVKLMIRFERIKGVYLTLKPFPEEVLTPTLKIKR